VDPFSATTMLGNPLGDVAPRSTWAITVATLQRISAVTIGVILLLLFTTLGQTRFDQGMDRAIHDLQQVLQEIETLKQTDQEGIPPPQLPGASGPAPLAP